MRFRRRGARGGTPLGGIIGGPVMVLIGLGMAYFGWSMRASTLEFVDVAESASGIVVELVSKTDSDGDILYYPVIEFTTVGGESIQYRSNVGSSPPTYDVGEEVEVLYESNLPQNAKVNSFVGLWMFSTILLAFGAIFLLFGVLSFLRGVATVLGIGSILGIGAWLLLRGKKEEDEQE